MSHGNLQAVVSEAEAAFSSVLREQTACVHREAERSGFLADLIRGRAARQAYALYLRNLVPVYAALEDALGRSEAPLAIAFTRPSLRREPSLRQDLLAVWGDRWEQEIEVLPASRAYAEAVHAATDGALVGHAYARYFGDLSGGQILRPVLVRSLALAPDALRFYDFPAIDIPQLKAALREALDRVDPAGPIARSIVLEALNAFRHNIALSQAVHAACG